MSDTRTAYPAHLWHEDLGDVLWWKFPVEEAPYVGTPNDLGHTVELHGRGGLLARVDVGGWPGYHTHWTPLPRPPTGEWVDPKPAPDAEAGAALNPDATNQIANPRDAKP
jgi:hypothetical protein